MHYDFLPVDPELQRPIQNVGDLLVVVAVFGDDATLFQEHARDHYFLANDKLALQQGIQIFERNRVPRNILQLRPYW